MPSVLETRAATIKLKIRTEPSMLEYSREVSTEEKKEVLHTVDVSEASVLLDTRKPSGVPAVVEEKVKKSLSQFLDELPSPGHPVIPTGRLSLVRNTTVPKIVTKLSNLQPPQAEVSQDNQNVSTTFRKIPMHTPSTTNRKQYPTSSIKSRKTEIGDQKLELKLEKAESLAGGKKLDQLFAISNILQVKEHKNFL